MNTFKNGQAAVIDADMPYTPNTLHPVGPEVLLQGKNPTIAE